MIYFLGFENDTVKSDCPMEENYEIFQDLIQTVGLLYYFTSLTVCSGYFQSFFSFFPRPPDPKSEKKNPVNHQLIKKYGLSMLLSVGYA